MANLRVLLQRREELRARIDRYQRELDVVDRQLFSRVERLAAVIDSEMSVSGTLRPEREGENANRPAPTAPDVYASSRPVRRPQRLDPQGQVGREVGLETPPLVTGMPSSGAVLTSSLPLFFSSTQTSLPTQWNGQVFRFAGEPHVRSAESIRKAIERPSRKISDAAIEVLRAAGRPLRTAEIYAQLLNMGVLVGGARPRNNLAAHLSNTPRIQSSEEGWKLVDAEAQSGAKEVQAPPA